MLWVMNTDPKHLYLCGPTALKMLMLAQHASPAQVKFLNKVRTGPQGTSLAEVAALAKQAKLALEPVFRKPGEPIPVPSIVHWKVGHFAAIVGLANGRYHLDDPTFGRQGLWVTQAALDAEASGYFLAPSKPTAGPVGARSPRRKPAVVGARVPLTVRLRTMAAKAVPCASTISARRPWASF